MTNSHPPLVPLHDETLLSVAKLARLDRISTEALLETLKPGQKDTLKAKPDRTVLDGHHRLHILKGRGVEIDLLPREIIEKIVED